MKTESKCLTKPQGGNRLSKIRHSWQNYKKTKNIDNGFLGDGTGCMRRPMYSEYCYRAEDMGKKDRQPGATTYQEFDKNFNSFPDVGNQEQTIAAVGAYSKSIRTKYRQRTGYELFVPQHITNMIMNPPPREEGAAAAAATPNGGRKKTRRKRRKTRKKQRKRRKRRKSRKRKN